MSLIRPRSHEAVLCPHHCGVYIFGLLASLWFRVTCIHDDLYCTGNGSAVRIDKVEGEIHSTNETVNCFWTFTPPYERYYGILTLTRNNDEYEDTLTIAGVDESKICTLFGKRCLSNFTYKERTYTDKCYISWFLIPKCETIDGEWKTCIPCIFRDNVDQLNEAKTYCYDNCDEDFDLSTNQFEDECHKIHIGTPAALNYSLRGTHDNITIKYKFIPCSGSEVSTTGIKTEAKETTQETTTRDSLPPLSTDQRTSKENERTTMLNIIDSTGAAPITKLVPTSTSKARIRSSYANSKFVRLGLPVIAAVLILLLIIIALICYRRKHHQQQSDGKVHFQNHPPEIQEENAVVEAPSEMKEMVDNILYGQTNVTSEKEVVDNVLYTSL